MNKQVKLMEKFLKKFDGTSFDVKFETGEELHIGREKPKFKVIVHQPVTYKKLLQSTSLALGEAYMKGDIEVEGNLEEALDEILHSFKSQFHTNRFSCWRWLYTSTSKKNQQKEVCAHYDIGNDFYKLWLDKSMSYSCGYFKTEEDTLEEAQQQKIFHILKKLQLKEGMSLLDIGCGWGSLLIEGAKMYKIHGLGITLSKEQYDAFKERIKKEKLEDYLQVKQMDYRELKACDLKFDRVVSVGMLEHVGRENYQVFFENVDSVLKESGLFLLHFISGYGEYPGDAWIKKYIFPGGVIPSLREIITLSANYKYYVQDVESLRRHYVKTLCCWHHRFEEHIEEIEKMFDASFIRMWRIYLCSCAASFNNGIIDLHQILFTKGINNQLPLTRDYLYEKKERL